MKRILQGIYRYISCSSQRGRRCLQEPSLVGQPWRARLSAEEVVQKGGHDDGRLLLGHADVPAQLLCAAYPPRSPVPACATRG